MPARRGSGRKPTPNVLKFKMGNPGKRPIKKEPTPPAGDLPSPPVHLDAYGIEEWNRIASGLHIMGVLTEIDQQTLAAYCGAYSRWRRAEDQIRRKVKAAQTKLTKSGMKRKEATEEAELYGLIDKTSNGNIIQNCLIGIANKAANDMIRYAAEFGLTPSARARLAIDPGKEKESKFKGLIGSGKK
ncbi:MAG: phage terminase small subunit P27 family [Syntrophales bacterium]|nr:phage terminase small subunit P27 family [Syntrophales bacterium]